MQILHELALKSPYPYLLTVLFLMKGMSYIWSVQFKDFRRSESSLDFFLSEGTEDTNLRWTLTTLGPWLDRRSCTYKWNGYRRL